MKFNRIKLRQSVYYAAAAGGIALIAGAGLFLGKPSPGQAPQETPQQTAQGVVATTEPEAPALSQTALQDNYVLKIDQSQPEGVKLSIFQGDKIITTVELPDGLPLDDIEALKAGMTFDTLEQIESFLEAFDS